MRECLGPIVTDYPSVVQGSTTTMRRRKQTGNISAGRRSAIVCPHPISSSPNGSLIYGAWDSLARIALQPAEPTTGSS